MEMAATCPQYSAILTGAHKERPIQREVDTKWFAGAIRTEIDTGRYGRL